MANLKRYADKLAAAFWNKLGEIVDKRRPRVALKLTSDEIAILVFHGADRVGAPTSADSIKGATATVSDAHASVKEDPLNPGDYLVERLTEDQGLPERPVTVTLRDANGAAANFDIDMVPGVQTAVTITATTEPRPAGS